jgi:CDP-2,3-bis-(O-geranylgeranyl)-sn-glycerol synthase
LPVLGSFLLHAPVLRFNLLAGLARPLDGGATLGGARVFGENKTLRGALVMGAGAFAATLALRAWPRFVDHLPASLRSADPFDLAARIAVGTVVAELPGSFVKRRLGIPPGERTHSPAGWLLSLWDQGDFVPGIALMLAPVWVMPWQHFVACFVAVSTLHVAVSALGFAAGARRTVL